MFSKPNQNKKMIWKNFKPNHYMFQTKLNKTENIRFGSI